MPKGITLIELIDITGAANGQFISANTVTGQAEWATGSGSGDVTGDDTSVTDQNIVAYNGTGGKNIEELNGTQGDVLYHNGTSWVALPAGTSGEFLKTQGAGANPVWDAAGGGGNSHNAQTDITDATQAQLVVSGYANSSASSNNGLIELGSTSVKASINYDYNSTGIWSFDHGWNSAGATILWRRGTTTLATLSGAGRFTATEALIAGAEIGGAERASDPSNPSEGNWVMWMSNGTGSGDDGDLMVKITAGGTTKTITLVDFSTF